MNLTKLVTLFLFCWALNGNSQCVPWMACDDGDPLTIHDKWDDDCNCVGSYINYDFDGDGVFDYIDNCPTTPNPNQADSDNDGLGDICDPTPNCMIGSPCDDGNPTTVTDVWDANCNCVGQNVNYDADNDGVLDYQDNCPVTPNPNQADSDNDGIGDVCDTAQGCIPWDSCNDGDPNTINDKWDDNCNCTGEFINYDSDNDGVFDYQDNCPVTYNPDQADSDNDGIGNVCDNFTNPNPDPVCVPWAACDDGDPLTIHDKWDDDCNCVGSYINYDFDNDGVFDYLDNCPVTYNPGQLDYDNDGVGNVCDPTPGSLCTVGGPCNDNNPNTTNDIYDVNCNCSGTAIPACTVGAPCNDNNPNTTNDIFDVNCNCYGIAVPTCTVGGPCNDNNPSTTNDIYDVNCNCAGTIIPISDRDNDGVPDNKDNCEYMANPDQADADNDGLGDMCDPLPNDCHQFFNYTGYEFGWGLWNDGGADSYRNYEPAIGANASNWCIRLRDGNNQESSMYTDAFNFTGVQSIKVDFMFLAISLEAGENFVLEYSTNGGNHYTTVETWVSGNNFTNNLFYSESVVFTGPFSDNTRLRFRCNGNTNSDAVYLDEVMISLCIPASLAGDNAIGSVTNDQTDTATISINEDDQPSADQLALTTRNQINTDVAVYPNPVSEILTITGLTDGSYYDVYSMNGQKVKDQATQKQVDVSTFESGMYFLRTQDGAVVRFMKQ